MESTSISDVRRMCQRGAFRAYVQGGKVFLEDTATGQVVPLNGESGPANTERRAAPHREDKRGSRVERMFGARDTWKSADPDADQGPYRGFLIVQCEECGAIKAFCAKHETYGYKCGERGHETPLEKVPGILRSVAAIVKASCFVLCFVWAVLCTHERPPCVGGGWACTSGGGCRRPCGFCVST